MDRNQATGLILISVMLLLYFSFFGGQPDLPQNTTTDTTAQDQLKTTQPRGN
jgi:hypothetical protein